MKPGRFASVELNAEQRGAVADVRFIFEQAEKQLTERVPAGRYHALMLTQLELACMVGIKGISHETGALTSEDRAAMMQTIPSNPPGISTKRTICVDFDGVLHSYTSPWVDAETIPDPLVPGAVAFLREAVEHYQVIIFSTRAKTVAGVLAMRAYLNAHGLGDVTPLLGYSYEKVPALAYIDDRAWRFAGTFPTMQDIAAQPWKVTT